MRVSNARPNRPPDADLALAGGGSGLAGLRHRVEVLGGTMTTGTTADGGFCVGAVLPASVPTGAHR
ncbi:hypothetical protein [Micromonospora sp. RP3T]|uniref:hypothetical protein n=1 Tax=Micromonospora sp. RP3T TaxID=2135446 RepID=UPI003D72806B